jgi:hypothetical protein
MITRQALLATAVVGALSLVGGIVAQTKKSVTITISTTPTVNVSQSAQCVDVDSVAGAPTDTLTWQIASGASGVTNFHIIFPKKSPFQNGQRYFDKDHSTGTLNNPQNGVAEAFEYVISVDGGKTCDPHVIIIGGRPKPKN